MLNGRIWLGIVALLLAATPVLAQEEADEQDIQAYLDERGQCLDVYRLGSVHFAFAEDESSRILAPGQTVTILGTVENANAYPMPEGKILARVLRQDQTVGDEHWHPVVEELVLPEIFSLPAGGSSPFTFRWEVPANAPDGIYRVEFNFLAGGRYSISGLAFVPNFTAGSRTFFVQGAASSTAVAFDRAGVSLNGKPYALRSVPPTFQPGEAITVGVTLTADGANPVPVTVTSELHEWSDIDGEAPVTTTTQELTATPGEAVEVPFIWESATPGVYELVMRATPGQAGVLPSVLKLRFPVEGNTPRIVFSGVTGFEGDEAVVTTCVVNGTFGSGGGTVATQVASEGSVIGLTEGDYDADGLTTITTRVPADSIRSDLAVATDATNEAGVTTDSHTVTYQTDELLAGEIEAARQAQRRRLIAVIILAVAVIVAIVLLVMIMRRKRKPPVLETAQPLKETSQL